MKYILPILVICLFSLHTNADSTGNHSFVKRKFVYHTSKAKEIYLVWGIGKWNTPDKKYWPKNTYIKDNLAYSRMESKLDSFSVTLSLEHNSRIDYMFWVAIDRDGKKSNGWDNNSRMNYYTVFDKEQNIYVNDQALDMPDDKFNILYSGKEFAFVSGILVLLLFFLSGRQFVFNKNYFVLGLWLAALVMSIIIRSQMNGLFSSGRVDIPGTVFSDFLWLLLTGLVLFGLLWLSSRIRLLNLSLYFFSITVLLATILFALLNIQIVSQLGRTLNYQWLYYSDFMQGIDTTNSLAKNFIPGLTLNLVLLLAASLLFGYAASLALSRVKTVKMKALFWLPAGLFFVISLYQYTTHGYPKNSTENPFLSLGISTITQNGKAPLFSMPVSETSRQYIREIHNIASKQKYDTSGVINNIVLFVFESTPRKYINLYDSTFDVTPNLKKWKGASRIYNNVYAHIPSTPNTMFSLVSGVYPLLSFKSAVSETPKIDLPSLPGELQKNGWISSLLFSADLEFSGMDEYARNQHFESIKDYKTIACAHKKFRNAFYTVEGLDDQCLADEYLRWFDANKQVKKFSILWTNQTHYPYFTHEENPQTLSGNKDLDRYLSALKNGDEAFGKLMQGLKNRNELDHTLVIVIGDHGEAFGTHNQNTHASKIYEENVHIPCVFYNPILFNGSIDQQLGGTIDIPATICHLSGIKKPGEWQGKSLLNATDRNRTYFIAPYSDFLFGTRTGDWKYIYNASTDKSELYDLKTDPKELNNLAYKYPSKVQEEYTILGAWVQYHTEKKLTKAAY